MIYAVQFNARSIRSLQCSHYTIRFWRHSSESTRRLRSSLSSPSSPSKLLSSNDRVVENTEASRKVSSVVKLDPRALFPWRHSSHPLPRLVPGTEEFANDGGYIGPNLPSVNVFLRSLAWLNSCGFLGTRLSQYGTWKRDIEDNFQHAFTFSVQGLLRDVYQLPNQDSKSIEENKSSAVHDDLSEADEDFPIHFNHFVEPGDDYNLKRAEQEEATNDMIDSSMISLYRSAHTYGKHKLQVKLKSRPKSCQMMSLIVIPFLTRDEVRDNISLKHSYKKIIKSFRLLEQEKGRRLYFWEVGNLVGQALENMSHEQMDRRGDNTMQITVVAQVAVDCDEIFVVRDIETGDVVQGDGNEELHEVTHLVRFETVMNLDSATGEIEIGSPWQITDWDDLMDGNIWFM